MTVSVSKTLLFSTGQISFSSLRDSFKESFAGSISASELIKNTSTNTKNPIVPDATENTAVSSTNNLSLSQFRNTIKYYDLNQSNTDLNLDVSSQSWNANLYRNIVKRVNINGTCGSNSIASPSLSLSGITYNVFLIINGSVLGAGGASSGGNGGSAMSLSSSGNAITIITSASASVYGGGGGGAKGAVGADGPAGTCYYFSDFAYGANCGGCPGCPGDSYQINCYGVGGCNCGKRGCGSSYYQSTCRSNVYYNTAAPAGGAGGDGGLGQGYNQTRTDGTGGAAGAVSDCSPYYTSTQTQGATGETGGGGGDWGTNGGTTTASAGGTSGSAITGSNYIISTDAVTAAFKGAR
jgi:hypothetical protein